VNKNETSKKRRIKKSNDGKKEDKHQKKRLTFQPGASLIL
jgi:hypothetical protein